MKRKPRAKVYSSLNRFSLKPYLFILPTFVLLLVFYYYCMVTAIGYSFTDYQFAYSDWKFVGFDNYIKVLREPIFLRALRNQLIITASSVIISILFPLAAAELIYFIRSKRVREASKTAFVLPMLVPGIVTLMMWKTLYNNFFGINSILDVLGLSSLKHDWLRDENTALFAVILIGFPFIAGLNFLIFHSALNAVSRDVRESAMLDGAKTLQIVWHIHIPDILPYIRVIAMLSIINSLQNYAMIAATTAGGPGYATQVPSLYMYNTAFGSSFNISKACTVGVYIFLVIILLTLLANRATSTKEERGAK